MGLLGVSLNAQVNLDSGLVGCYPFSGNANDMSGNNNNGVVHGAVLSKDRFNKPNSAYYFNRADTTYISIANFDKMIPGQDVSISIWGKSTAYSSTSLFLAVPDVQNDRFAGCAEYTGGPFIIWDYGDFTSNGRMIYSQSQQDTNWHHYVYVVSKTKNIKSIYEDGIQVMTSAYTVDYTSNGRPLYIGGYTDWSKGLLSWSGYIDDIRIYDRALDGAEVSALYTGSNTICSTAGVASLSESGLKIFKSEENEIQINVGDMSINGNIRIVNILGQVLLEKNIQAMAYYTRMVNISGLSAGMYMVVLTSDNQQYTTKFIK